MKALETSRSLPFACAIIRLPRGAQAVPIPTPTKPTDSAINTNDPMISPQPVRNRPSASRAGPNIIDRSVHSRPADALPNAATVHVEDAIALRYPPIIGEKPPGSAKSSGHRERRTMELIALSQARPYLAAPPRSKPDFGPWFGRWPSRLGAFPSQFFDAVGRA